MERLTFGTRAQAHRFAREVEYAQASSGQAERDVWTGLSTGDHIPFDAPQDAHAALVELARSLRAHKPVGAAPAEFTAALRHRLLTEDLSAAPAAQRAPVRWRSWQPASWAPLQTWSTQWSSRRRWVAAAALGLMLSGTAGTAMASESALPGQPLYPVKRKLEDVRIALAWDEGTRGKLYVEQANERLEEAETLAKKPGAAHDPALKATVRDLVNSARESSEEAQKASPDQAASTRKELAEFIQKSAPRLDALKQTVKSEPALASSLDSLSTLAPSAPATPATPDSSTGTGTPASTPVQTPTAPPGPIVVPPPVVSPPTASPTTGTGTSGTTASQRLAHLPDQPAAASAGGVTAL
jgi:hypothetical protein